MNIITPWALLFALQGLACGTGPGTATDPEGAEASTGTGGATASGGSTGERERASTGGERASTGGTVGEVTATASTGTGTQDSSGVTEAGASTSTTDTDDREAGEPCVLVPAPASPGEPALESLAVAGGSAPLHPPFDPSVHRYAVRLSEPSAPLVVTASPVEGGTLSWSGETVEPGAAVTVSGRAPGEVLELDVVGPDEARSTYHIVLLPADFPDLRVTTWDPRASADPIYLALRHDTHYVAKLDDHGVPLLYRRVENEIFDFKRHPGGQLSYAERVRGSSCEHVVLDERCREVERVTTVDLQHTDVHDFHILPNDHYIVMAYEPTRRDLSEYGGNPNQYIRDGVLQELGPGQELLFEWNSWGHFPYEESLNGNRSDYAHLNSVMVADDGNWIVSAQGLSQVVKIDRTTGEVLWRFGGISNEFEILDDSYGNLCGQHTASELPGGNLLIFDNGTHCWPEVPERGSQTRVVEYALDEDARTATLVWSYEREGAFTVAQGSAQRLANGNTFIGWGMGSSTLATEVSPDGEVVFELEAPLTNRQWASYRAWRFAD